MKLPQQCQCAHHKGSTIQSLQDLWFLDQCVHLLAVGQLVEVGDDEEEDHTRDTVGVSTGRGHVYLEDAVEELSIFCMSSECDDL